MNVHLRRITALAALLLAFLPQAGAQTGPSGPRLMMAALKSSPPSGQGKELQPVSLILSVGNDGRVQSVALENSSGDARFDRRLSEYYQKVRFIPALDDAGTPIESTYRFRFKTQSPPSRTVIGIPNPSDVSTTATSSGPSNDKVFDEVARVRRMRCRDFLWEYDLMRDIAGARPVYDELLFRTVQAMYIVSERLTGDAVRDLQMQFTRGVHEAAEQCHERPDGRFYDDVFVPTLRAKLAD